MLWHDDIAKEMEFVSTPVDVKRVDERLFDAVIVKKRQPAVTTESYESSGSKTINMSKEWHVTCKSTM